MMSMLSRSALIAAALGILTATACRDAPPAAPSTPESQGLEGFFNPQPGEVWTYAVTRDFAPGSKLRPAEAAKATELPNGAKRVSFERKRICAGLERPEGAEKDLTAFELHEDGLLVEREFYDITSAGLIGRGWTPAPEVTPAVKPPPKGILLNPGVTIAQPRMVGGQSWTAPGVKSGPLFRLDIIERTTITVPAGEFETARIRLTTEGPKRSTKRTLWFAENIGIVKEEVAHYDAEHILVTEELVLTKWSLPTDQGTLPSPPVSPPDEPGQKDDAEAADTGEDSSDPDAPPAPDTPEEMADEDDEAPGDKTDPSDTSEPEADAHPPAEEGDPGAPSKEGDPDTPAEEDDSETTPDDPEPAPPKAEIIEE